MTREEDRLLARYNEAVGWALELGILVYVPGRGGMMKCLGDLEDEIRAARGDTRKPFEHYLAMAYDRR